MKGSCGICKVACLLVIVGALNWGLVGAFGLDLVARFLGEMTVASRIVYGLVGLAGLAKLISCFKDCPACKK
jgi:uncharacterized membrane protein YuzA (DUF378 family)